MGHRSKAVTAGTAWSGVRERISGASSARRDGLWSVPFRLAAQTVGLLLVMLVALEVVVYLITQQTLLGSLEDTLRSRAAQPDPTACVILRLPCGTQGRLGPGGPQRGPGPGGAPRPAPSGSGAPRADLTPSDATSVFVDRQARVIHADGALGAVLLDQGSARQALRTRQDQCCSVDHYKGGNYLVYTRPLLANGRVAGAVQTSISEGQYQGTMQTLLRALLLVALLGLLVSAAISAVLVHRALKPVRISVQRQRDFVADAAHELRTPLAIMRTVGEVGMDAPSVDELQATIAQMLSENQHLTRLVDDLSLLARTDTDTVALDRRPVDLSALIADTAGELGFLAEEQGVALEADVEDGIRVTGDALRLRQMILILLDNALRHTPAGGSVQLRLFVHGGSARLQVADSGPGIAPADLSRIFDRFYRADQARSGGGSGLGLAIGKWIVEAHGGHIQAGNASPHGAVFTVTLPAARAAAVP